MVTGRSYWDCACVVVVTLKGVKEGYIASVFQGWV
jgi:hypothetical protein